MERGWGGCKVVWGVVKSKHIKGIPDEEFLYDVCLSTGISRSNLLTVIAVVMA